jgi:hypothetical protein
MYELMYEQLTGGLLDLTVGVKGRKSSSFAMLIVCCSSSCCCGARVGSGGDD